MNRLSPLIVRRYGHHVPLTRYPAAEPATAKAQRDYEDLKLFATGWFGGLIFFGTLLS
jgi:hypothetical protein